MEDDGLKDGLRSSADFSADGAGLPADEAELLADDAEFPPGAVSFEAASFGAASFGAGESLFVDRPVNQLSAAPCGTVWRPLSGLPFGDPSALPGWAQSSAESDAGLCWLAGDDPRAPDGFFGFPISSAGNGTGRWARVAAEPTAVEFALSAALPASSAALPASAVSGAELAEFSGSSVTALAPDRGAPESDEPVLVRGEDMTSLSAVASTVSSSGSISDLATPPSGTVL